MVRPRKPTEILELNGAFEKNPDRRREIGPKSAEPVGDPPWDMDPEAQACWRETVGEAAPNVLTAADRGTVEVVAVMRAKLRAGTATAGDIGHLLRGYTELGMTPASRSKVTAVGTEKPAEETPWAFLSRAGSPGGKGAN